MSKKSGFRGPLDKQHERGNQTLLKPEPHTLYHIYWLLWRQLRWRKSLLVICKILRLFVKTLNVGHKYCLLNRENLKKPIQYQLSGKQKTFSELFSAILKSRKNFEHFEKQDDSQSWCISEITESQNCGKTNIWKVPWPFDKQW